MREAPEEEEERAEAKAWGFSSRGKEAGRPGLRPACCREASRLRPEPSQQRLVCAAHPRAELRPSFVHEEAAGERHPAGAASAMATGRLCQRVPVPGIIGSRPRDHPRKGPGPSPAPRTGREDAQGWARPGAKCWIPGGFREEGGEAAPQRGWKEGGRPFPSPGAV